MTAPDEKRISRYALELGEEPQAAAADDAAETIAAGQRDLTEVTRLEADRRKRIESDSLQEITALQAEALRQRQDLLRQATQPAERRASDGEQPPPPAQRSLGRAAELPEVELPPPAEAPVQSEPPTPKPAAPQPPLQVEVAAQREIVV